MGIMEMASTKRHTLVNRNEFDVYTILSMMASNIAPKL